MESSVAKTCRNHNKKSSQEALFGIRDTKNDDFEEPPRNKRRLNSPDPGSGEQREQVNFNQNDGSQINEPASRLSWNEEKPSFSVVNAILSRLDILHELIKYLSMNDLLNLYAISKDFHRVINVRMTTLVVDQANACAPESANIFRFTYYRSLCLYDPGKRTLHHNPERIRAIPTFRWLRLVLHREKIVARIIKSMAVAGHHLPPLTSRALKLIWLMMDIPDTPRRIGMVHSLTLWPHSVLSAALMFFIKLDMRFTNPVNGNGERRMRRLLMAQRTLAVLDRVLRREQMRNHYDMVQMLAEWRLNLPKGVKPQHVFDIPWEHLGRLQREGWTKQARALMRPDDVILREVVGRRLLSPPSLLDMMLWGYIDEETWLDRHPEEPSDNEIIDEPSEEESLIVEADVGNNEEEEEEREEDEEDGDMEEDQEEDDQDEGAEDEDEGGDGDEEDD